MNKKINQLTDKTAVSTDLMLVGDPTTGTSYKSTLSSLPLVPYTGATTNVNLGEYQLTTGQVTFDQSPTGIAGVGVMRWNNTDGTLDLGLKGGNVTLQIGQEQVQRVVNKSGIQLTEANYQVVKVTSAQGQRLAVDLAQGNNDANSTDTIGIVTENIDNNQEGFICTSGLVREINTTGSLQSETWVDGDVLYLSPTVAGQITNIKPTAPSHTVILGYVVYAHAIHGKIFVKCDNGYELSELHNVYAPSPNNNDGIFWNNTNLRYENNSISGILGYTPVTSARTISTTSPLSGGGDLSANRTLAITQATTITDGYLSSTDWNTFNSKESALTFSSPLTRSVNTISIPVATTSVNGYLSSTDWTTFNGKFNLPSLTSGSVLFSNGTTISQNNANFFWDDTNNRLGINTNIPSTSLHIVRNDNNYNEQLVIDNPNSGNAAISYLTLRTNSVNGGGVAFYGNNYITVSQRNSLIFYSQTGVKLGFIANANATGLNQDIYFATKLNNPNLTIFSTGNLLIQNSGTHTDLGYRLDVNGTSRLNGKSTLTGSVTAASLLAQGVLVSPTLVAAANNDVLVGLDINPTFTNGVFTGVTNYGARISGRIKLNGYTTTSSYSGTVVGYLAFDSSGNILTTTAPSGGSMAIGGSITSATAGSVLFAGTSGVLAQDNANFFWDGTNNRLGIGTTTPSDKLHIATNITNTNNTLTLSAGTGSANIISFKDASGNPHGSLICGGSFAYGTYLNSQLNLLGGTNGVALRIANTAASSIIFYGGNADIDFSQKYFQLYGNTGNVVIQNGGTFTDNGQRLQVMGTSLFNDNMSFATNKGFASSVTFGTIGTGTGMYWDNTNNRLGIGIGSPTTKTHIVGAATGSTPIFLVTNNSSGNFTFMVNNSGTGNANFGFQIDGTTKSTIGHNRSGDYLGFFHQTASLNYFLLQLNSDASFQHNKTSDGTADFKIFNNGGTIIGSSTLNASAQLQVDSTTKGFLPPRMTTTQKNAIATPAAGLQVYDSTLNQMSYYNGTTWINF